MKYVIVLTNDKIIELEFHSRHENVLFLINKEKEGYYVKTGRGKIHHIIDGNVYKIENYDSEYLICDCGEEINLQEEKYFECYIDEYDYCSLNCCINKLVDDEYIFVNESGEYLLNHRIYKNKEDLIGIIGDYK